MPLFLPEAQYLTRIGKGHPRSRGQPSLWMGSVKQYRSASEPILLHSSSYTAPHDDQYWSARRPIVVLSSVSIVSGSIGLEQGARPNKDRAPCLGTLCCVGGRGSCRLLAFLRHFKAVTSAHQRKVEMTFAKEALHLQGAAIEP